MSKDKDSIDEKFDKAEKVWDRLSKLILKVVGGVVGIGLAVYIGYDQILDKKEEVAKREAIVNQHELDSSVEEHSKDYTLTKTTYFVDDYGNRMGDTVYVDYYSDGYIDKYYIDGEDYVDDYPKGDSTITE